MHTIILSVILLLISVSESKKSAKEIPTLLVQNGDLIFRAAENKNIQFKSPVGVTINNIDLLTTLNKAANATILLDKYKTAFSTYSERLDDIEQRIDVPVRWSNSSDSSITLFSIRRLRRLYRAIQRTVTNIEEGLKEDNCVGNPCKNGGTCQDMYKNYMCRCLDGWQGPNCLEDVNECSKFLGTDLGCQNGAECFNTPGSYRCECKSGFVGIHCTRRKADCSISGKELCGHGTCVQQNNDKGYKCICDQGWTTDGTSQACTEDVNECTSNHPSCSKNPSVSCINVPGSFYCGPCPTGYTGNGYYCADINECAVNNGGCSLNPMVTCVNTQGSRMCGICPPGYQGDGVTCSFKGVCNVNNGGCHHLALCRDNPRISSTYVECICPTGYIGNGIGPNSCILSNNINPCAPNPCVNGDCSVNNVTGEYMCSCRRRYTGRNCDILKDPCSPNPCQNGGTCINLIGVQFQCACVSGFSGTQCQNEAQACGGKLSGTTGVLKYPPGDYETYGHRLGCSWTIETNITKVLNITFTKFDIEESTECRSDWLQIHDGRNSVSRPFGRFCGTDLPLGGKIITTSNFAYLWFRSNARNAKTGFQLVWNATNTVCGGASYANSHGTIQSPGSPGNYPLNRDCYWTLLAPFGKRLLFHFYSLDIGNNADCNQDYIEFYSVIRRNVFAKFCNSSIPAPFYSPNEIVGIHFHSDSEKAYSGFQITYSTAEAIPGCGGIYTAEEGVIQSVSLEGTSTDICEYRIQQTFNKRTKITFLILNIKDTPGCREDYVELREGPNVDSPLIGRYCGNTLPPSFISNSQITIVSSVLRGSHEWKINYKKFCGKKFYNRTGSFESPSQISYNSDCIYQIEQPPGYVIELNIKIDRTQAYILCSTNYIEVRDGDHDNATLIKRFCESGSEIITSTYNHLWIRQYVKSRYALKFKATYTTTEIGCGGILKSKMGNIASPTEPDGYYPPNLKCSWVIIAPPNSVIQLTWLTFSLEQSYECTYDNIQVFDNNTDIGMGGLIGKYCGSALPPILLSSANIMTIVFTTDVSNHMEGFLATYIFLPQSRVCGGSYHTAAGVIKSPNYPRDYPPNKDCTWTITVPSGQQILLNITDFSLEQYVNCRYDSIEIRNGGTTTSPLIGKYCGTSIPTPISSHTNKLYLHFISDPNRESRGFRITWSSTATGCGGTLTSPSGSIISPNYPEPYSRNTDCTWKIIIGSGSRIQVIFSDIDLEPNVQCNSDYVPDYVQLFDGLTINSKSLGKFCHKENTPLVSSNHKMLVKFRSDVSFQGRGFQLHYSTICNNTLRGYGGVIESPNFPDAYPQDLNCWWDIIVSDKNKINITFSHFEIEGTYPSHNNCISDYLEIKYFQPQSDYDSNDIINVGKYCGNDNPGQISINSDHAQIHFVSDKWIVGSGFRLEWQLFGCGGLLTRSSGTIQSPNYPKPYPPSIKCEWKIEVEFGQRIEIEFHKIDIEKDDCDYDWIQVYNGPDNSSNVISKLCFQDKPIIVISSTGNQMFVEFQSDYSYQGIGFTANYSTVSTKCGGKFTAPEGAIMSPNYPKNFDKNDTCYWFIEIDENHSIELTFEDADLPPDCNKNYIKVYDGPTEAYPVLKKVCDTAPNDTIKSTFNEMYIEFRTSSYYTTKGFLAKYKKSCGSRITTQGTGTIQVSPHDFKDYLQCTWTIVSTDPSLHITLTITHLQMYVYDCEEETPIQIFGGETTNSSRIQTYCGTKIPPPLVSDGSAITIQLSQSMDFFATYSVLDSHCGATFNTVNGFFSTPGYPKKYASDIQCEWTINVAAGNHIALSFIEFDILESENCNTDFLEIRSNNVSGPLLGTYCGKNKPRNITHQGTLWMMYKASKLESGTTVTAKGFYGEFELNTYNELRGPQGTIASPLYPKSYFDYNTFSWRITVSSGKRILLTFKEFYVESDNDDEDCYSAKFTVYDGIDETSPFIKALCGVYLPDPIKSSSNVLFISVEYNYVRLGTTFVVEWLEISNVPSVPTTPTDKTCGSSNVIDMSSMGSYTLTSPGYPYGYKANLNCEWIFSTISMNHLTVFFMDMNIRNFMPFRHMACNGDYVSLYQKGSEENEWELVKKTCRKDDVNNLQFTNLLKVQFVTNQYLNGTGFRAHIYQRCGGSMTGPTGYIYYNSSIKHDYGCEWNVTVRSGKTIRVTFENLNITNDAAKCNNYIMLKNGRYADSPILGNGKYCGPDLPEPLNTTGNHLYVKYNGSSTINGFRLKYQEISVECGGEIILSSIDNSTEINSPNYPNIPLPHTECSWVIRAPPDESLRIDFDEQFDLTYRRGCDIEYVEVRDGGTEFSPLLGRFCNKAPNTIFSTGNMIFVKFFTNTEDPKNGFKAKVSLTYCGGTIRDTKGEIKSPTRETKEPKRSCTWHIIGPLDHYLNIEFLDFNLNTGSNKIIITENDVIFNNVTKLAEYTGTVLPLPLTTSSNEAIINYVGTSRDRFRLKFNASQSACGGILKIESGTITSPGYPVMNHLHRYCQWTIIAPERRRITLEFTDLDLDNANFHDQGIVIFDGSVPFKIALAFIRPGSPKKIYESSSNEMMISFWSNSISVHRGFKATFNSNQPTICSSDFSSDSGVLSQPDVRNSSYYCKWNHRSSNSFFNETFALNINLKANFTRRYAFLNCTYAPWSITVTNQEKYHILASLCTPTIKNYTVRSPYPITEVTATAKTQMNFTVQYHTFKCGGMIRNQEGFISSPNYPSKPTQSVECAWIIKVDRDQTINLTTLNMDLGNDCDKSFITVYNGEGPSHPQIGKYCKDIKPGVIISQSHNLWIEYKHEAGSTGTGFKIKYQAKSEGCGGIYHDRNRVIQSPNYGKDYPNSAECSWEIRASPGYSIRLQFIGRFQLEDSENCVNDYIEIFDWRDDKWTSIGRKCGREIPTNLHSTGDKLRILFRTNYKTTASGFKIRWDWFCGGTFEATETPRSIVSPGYPVIYNSSLNCVYNITTKADVLSVAFDDFELENGATDCIYDNVTITGKYYSTYAPFTRTYCGTTKPPPFRMRGNIIVTFKTDRWVNRKGFKFTYSDESCGGDINKTTTIDVPAIMYRRGDFRYFYPKINCVWKITAPPKQVAILRVLKLALPTSCYNQGLDIYNGLNYDTVNRLASFCGNLVEIQPIHADSGNMLVRLSSNPISYGGFKAEVYFSHGPAEGCGGTINLTEVKYINSPDLEDLDCTWRIIAPRDYQIQIQFTEFNIPGACSTNRTSEYFCTCSYVEVRDGGGPLSELIEKLCSTSNDSPDYRKFSTSWNTGYIRFVLAGRQNNAFKATLTPVLSQCGPTILNATKEVQTLTSPNYPNHYPPSTKCNWLIMTKNLLDKIELHFVAFNLTGRSDSYINDNKCDGDRAEIIENPNSHIVTEGLGPQAIYNPTKKTVFLSYNNLEGRHAFCGVDETPFDYFSTGRSLTISFRSMPYSTQGTGFKLEYRIAGCTRNYTNLQGRIFNYNDKSECFMTISVPQNRTISLYFQKFMMTYSFNCSTAVFEVRDNGPQGTVLMRSCGYRVPNPIFSYTNNLYIHIVARNGYMLTYDAVYTSTDAGRGCGGELYNYKGRISSPLYPNEFRNSSICNWKIRVPTGLQAALKFTSFDLQGACDQTYVSVTTYTGSTGTKKVFCRNDQPAIIRSNSRIDIEYKSSVHNGGTGWLAVFQGVSDDAAVL